MQRRSRLEGSAGVFTRPGSIADLQRHAHLRPLSGVKQTSNVRFFGPIITGFGDFCFRAKPDMRPSAGSGRRGARSRLGGVCARMAAAPSEPACIGQRALLIHIKVQYPAVRYWCGVNRSPIPTSPALVPQNWGGGFLLGMDSLIGAYYTFPLGTTFRREATWGSTQ